MSNNSKYSTEKVLSVHHWNDTLFSFKTTRQDGLRFENGQFVFYANATPFSFDANSSELSLVINATISTN